MASRPEIQAQNDSIERGKPLQRVNGNGVREGLYNIAEAHFGIARGTQKGFDWYLRTRLTHARIASN